MTDALASPIVKDAKTVVGIAFAEHNFHFVVGIESRVVGQYVEATTLCAVLPQLLRLDCDLAKAQACGVSSYPVLKPVLITANCL